MQSTATGRRKHALDVGPALASGDWQPWDHQRPQMCPIHWAHQLDRIAFQAAFMSYSHILHCKAAPVGEAVRRLTGHLESVRRGLAPRYHLMP